MCHHCYDNGGGGHLMITYSSDYSMSDCHAFFIPDSLVGNVLVPDGKTKAVWGPSGVLAQSELVAGM